MNDNMTLRDLIEALTAQLSQSMPTAQTNVSGFFRNNNTGEIVLRGEICSEREAELLDQIEDARQDRRIAYNAADEARGTIADLEEKLRWAESEVNRLKLERNVLLTS